MSHDLAMDEPTVFHFPQGLPGFEELTRYLRCEREGLQPLTLLVALDAEDVTLPLLPSSYFLPDYSPLIPAADLELLEVKGQDELELFIVTAFEENGGGVTVNLRAPICFNSRRRLGRQVILPDGSYPLFRSLLPAPN